MLCHVISVGLDETGVVEERGRLLGVLVAPDEFMVEARCRPWLPRVKVKRRRILVAFSESLRSIVVERGAVFVDGGACRWRVCLRIFDNVNPLKAVAGAFQ